MDEHRARESTEASIGDATPINRRRALLIGAAVPLSAAAGGIPEAKTAPAKRAPHVVVVTGSGLAAEETLVAREATWARGELRDIRWQPFPESEAVHLGGVARDRARTRAGHELELRCDLSEPPRPIHRTLARLEHALQENGGSLLVCTENVDTLHEQAGSRDVVHLYRSRCTHCAGHFDYLASRGKHGICPLCGAEGGVLVNWSPSGATRRRTTLRRASSGRSTGPTWSS